MGINVDTGTKGERKIIFTPEEIGKRMENLRDRVGGTVDLTKWIVCDEYIGGATVYRNIDTGVILSVNSND
jgi:hypothetical protein